jgi:hypothetical protein
MKFYLAVAMLGLANSLAAQTPTPPSSSNAPGSPDVTLPVGKRHGALYLSWGYNRDWYTRSDIRFRNTDPNNSYDFTFHNAHASDKPDFKDFWRFNSLTIPQYDLTVGYLFGDKHDLGIEVSWNHLKYVVDDNQLMHVTGQIHGRTLDVDTVVTPNFVHLQHTNGNNYLMVNLVKRWQLRAGRHLRLSAIGKVGAGPMISYTISTVLGSHEEGPFHYHGWVVGTSAGLRLDVFRYFFLQSDVQGAFADYTNTWLGADKRGRATHVFGSGQLIWAFGFNAPL